VGGNIEQESPKMQTLKSLFDSPAVNVFLDTLPLLGAIVWGLLQNDKRLNTIEQRLGRMETRIDSIDGNLSSVRERLVRVETKLEGGHVVLTRS
jgi:hypothetical protein